MNTLRSVAKTEGLPHGCHDEGYCKNDGAGAGDHGDPVGPKGEPGRPILTEDEEDDDDALPEIDAAEGIVEEEPPVRSAKRKKARA